MGLGGWEYLSGEVVDMGLGRLGIWGLGDWDMGLWKMRI